MPSWTPFLASALRERPGRIAWDEFGQRSGLSRSRLAAIRDIVEGLGRWELWSTTAWYDIRQRYRRSVLGPFWLTLSMGILVGTMGILYAHLFGQSVADYVPYLALGLIAWTFIATFITEGSNVFITYSGLISQAKAPLSTHVFRVVWRNLIIFAHNIWIYVAVAIIFGIWPGATGLLVIPGLLPGLPQRCVGWPPPRYAVRAFPGYSSDHRQCGSAAVLSDAYSLETRSAD